MKIYIAGKISGLVYEDAYCAFVEAEQVLKRLGHEAVNPMRENGLAEDGTEHPWAQYMKRVIPHLLRCDGIYLLQNWRDSRGAKIESQLARDLEMKVFYQSHHVCGGCGVGLFELERTVIRLTDKDIACPKCFELFKDRLSTIETPKVLAI